MERIQERDWDMIWARLKPGSPWAQQLFIYGPHHCLCHNSNNIMPKQIIRTVALLMSIDKSCSFEEPRSVVACCLTSQKIWKSRVMCDQVFLDILIGYIRGHCTIKKLKVSELKTSSKKSIYCYFSAKKKKNTYSSIRVVVYIEVLKGERP